jgi:hypothetical protein
MNISICYYSTIFSTGYKSKQLSSLINKLKEQHIDFTTYSIEYNLKNFLIKENNHYKTSIPLIPLWLYGKFPFKLYPSYYNYLLGELLFYFVFRKIIINDNSNIVLVRNRPSRLLKYIKKNTLKSIIMEVDQQHPLFTMNTVLDQQKKYSIPQSNIYLNKFAINDYIESFKYADFIIVYTENQKNILIKYGVKNKIFINELGIENKINFNNFRLIHEKKEIDFICFANHSLLKGTHRLVEIWNKYKINKKLYIVGSQEGDFKQFLKNQHSISNNIIFVEKFTKNDLKEISLKNNLVGVLLSYSEGYPRVVSEFFENLIPVIVSKIIDRNIENLNFGKIVNNEDDEDILNAINTMSDVRKYIDCQENIIKYNFPTNDDFIKNYIKIILDCEL